MLNITDCRVQPGDCAYVIDDGTTAILHDTGFGFTGYQIADKIEKLLGDRKLDYILLSHSHYDHAMATPYIKRKYPEAKVVAGHHAAGVFQRPGARRVMSELDSKFAATCGIHDYECLVDELAVDIAVYDGDIIKAGSMEFQVLNLPGHTKCSVGYYCKDLKFFISTETLGVYDGDKVIIPSYLVGVNQSLESIDRVSKMDIRTMLSPHYGVLNEDQTRYFLSHMREASYGLAQWIKGLVEQGRSDNEIFEMFKDRFWHGEIRRMYPVDALILNTSIMTTLIKKELLGIEPVK